MKKLTFILLSIAALSLASCDNISPEVANAFKGEYWMETSSVAMKGDSVVDRFNTKWSPVKIYEENGKLWVRTNWYGAPYLSDDNEHAEPIEVYNEKPDYVSQRRVFAEDGEDDIIDVVVTDNKPILVVQNGQICVIRNGEYWKSEPIKVKSGSSTTLELEKFTPVDVAITDRDGKEMGTVKCTYVYGPMAKKEDAIRWQVDLQFEGLPSVDYAAEFDHVVHTNMLYKK